MLNATAATEAGRESLGLCLSGGGFRAAFYSLGALRYLAEAGRLGRVDVISSVSGGSTGLKTFAPALAVDTPAWNVPEYSDMSPTDRDRLLRLLERGAKRKLWRRR